MGPATYAQLKVPTWLRQSIALSSAPWAAWPAGRAMAAAGTIAIVGVAAHRLTAVALMFFGAACAVAFVGTGSHRTRLLALIAQGSGAVAGLAVGAIGTSSDAGKVIVAAAVGLLSGMLGAIGRLVTAFALMAVIGTSYEQFGGLPLPWYEQAGWYVIGTTFVSAAAILPLRSRRQAYERAAVAAVFDASAELLDAVGTPAAGNRRGDLAAASSVSRDALQDHRILATRRSTASPMRAQLLGSQRVAFVAAALYARGLAAPRDVIDAITEAGSAVRRGDVLPPVRFAAGSLLLQSLSAGLDGTLAQQPGVEARPPGLVRRLRSATRTATEGAALLAGIRLAWCMALATTLTLVLHQKSHSYWLPLTVAVVVRPEYASVFVRTVNRVIGSIGGAVVAAIALLVLPSGGVVALAATLSIGWAVASAPKLYALSVIGITGSALLSASIGVEDPVYPALRLLDTLLGCAVAVVFGYLLWPGRHTHPFAARPGRATDDAVAYLRQAARAPSERSGWPSVRDRAYASAHLYRASVQAALADPPPVSTAAGAALADAVALEDVVDAVNALDVSIRSGGSAPAEAEVQDLANQIFALATGDGAGRPDLLIARLAQAASGPPILPFQAVRHHQA
ncbi:MAG TPA: FUSC family protein [Frankiaceae bacterium]|nr:FUSC family protein [Frankiaceae bacterium]